MSEDIKPSKVLWAAADILGRGWCQGALGLHPDGYILSAKAFQPGAEIDKVCLQGAMVKAVVDLTGVGWVGEGDEAVRTLYAHAENAILRVTNPGVRKYDPALIPSDQWNDRPGRTQTEVLEVLHEAAAAEEEAGR